MILIYCDGCDGRYEVKTSSLLIEQTGMRHGKAIYRLSARCPGCHEISMTTMFPISPELPELPAAKTPNS